MLLIFLSEKKLKKKKIKVKKVVCTKSKWRFNLVYQFPKLYLVSLLFFQIQVLIQNLFFIIFKFLVCERRESIPGFQRREDCCFCQFWPPKWLNLLSTSSIWWKEFDGVSSKPQYYQKKNGSKLTKKNLTRFDFVFWTIFRVSFTDKLISISFKDVYKVFSVKFC